MTGDRLIHQSFFAWSAIFVFAEEEVRRVIVSEADPCLRREGLDRLQVQRAVIEARVIRIDESLSPNAQRRRAQSIVEGCPENGIRFEHHVRSLVSETGIDCGLGRIFVPGQSSCGGKNAHIICIEKQRSTLDGGLGKGRRRRQP